MTKTIALITAAMVLSTSVTAQKVSSEIQEYVVANSYEEQGCTGKRSNIAAIPTGKCFYAQSECDKNKDLGFACSFLETMTIGKDVSFIAVCNNQYNRIEAQAWQGPGCQGELIGGQSLPIPVKTCLQDFEIACSTNPNFVIREERSSTENSAISINVGILGLLGLLVN